MSLDKTLLRMLLQISEPWAVREYKVDLRNRRCDVWIGIEEQRGWFGRSKKSVVDTRDGVWRHVNFGSMSVYLHVAAPVGADLSSLGWVGDEGLPFTRQLAKQVFALFSEGVTLRAICALLDIPLSDVWRYRFALDNGKVGVVQDGAEAPAPVTRNVAAAAAVAEESSASAVVPDVGDPVWTRLVTGDMALDIRVLSLKLMLSRLRSQLDVISDDEVRMLKLRELHRYFVKNERMLSHELAQLRTA